MRFVFYGRVPLRAGLNFIIQYVCAPVADRGGYFFQAVSNVFGVYRGRKEQIMFECAAPDCGFGVFGDANWALAHTCNAPKTFTAQPTVALLIGS
jgi:hypothetical protein